MSSDVRITTGQSDFSYGIDSSRVPLIQSQGNPNGLPNNALSWAVNVAVRSGGCQQRFGCVPLCKVSNGNIAYQGGILYDNSAQGGNPYLMLSIGGRMIQVRVDTDNSVHDVTGAFADPPTIEKAYFAQGEQFMVKQAGDGLTLPLFWDGFTLRRSIGQNFNQGVTNGGFVVPAYGQSQLVTLNAPYTGSVNANLQLWDPSMTPAAAFINFVQVIPGNFFLIKNVSGPPGLIIPAGTQVILNGAVIGVLLAPYTTPAVGASLTAYVTPSYTGPALPQNVQINGSDFQITFTGAGAPGANQVYLVNTTVQNGAGHPAGDTIPTATVMYANRELPAAQSMIYYMGRLWYSQNRKVTAGDIVDGPSGTIPYNNTDSILKVTENPLAVGGDGFSVPAQAGNIKGLNFPTALDQTLGQGPLFVFTEKQIYSLQVPVTRTAWINANNSTQPLMAVVQKTNGTVSDRTVVSVNGDLFFQSVDPAIRTYQMGLRYFGTSWANPPISNNIQRIMLFNNRALMHMAFGFEFGSRVYEGVLPVQTPCGVACTALASLDTDPVSTLQNQRPPVWDGPDSGFDILQGFSGSFGGLERAFLVTHNRIDGSIWVVEKTTSAQFDTNVLSTSIGNAQIGPVTVPTGEVRVPMLIETPAFDWNEYPRSAGGGVFEAKELDGLDLWLDRIFGEVLVTVEFRPDEISCWYLWGKTKICAARTCAESVNNPACYPVVANGELYRNPLAFPKPTNPDCQPGNNRPVTIGYKFQLRITTLGWCRLRGYQLHAIRKDVAPFSGSICDNATSWMSTPPPNTFPAPLPPPPPPPTPTPTPTGTVFGNPDTGEIFGTSTGDEFGFGP